MDLRPLAAPKTPSSRSAEQKPRPQTARDTRCPGFFLPKYNLTFLHISYILRSWSFQPLAHEAPRFPIGVGNKESMMLKIFEDLGILSVAVSTFLIVMLATLPLGSVGFLPILPLSIAGTIFYLRRYAEGKRFFFEVWSEEKPMVGRVILCTIVVILGYTVTAILLTTEIHRMNLNTTLDSAEEEIAEFFR